MRASLDTNVIIHFYRANLQNILFESADASQTVTDFNAINTASDLKWTFRSQVAKFIKRFWKEPYKKEDKQWIDKIMSDRKIKVKSKFTELSKLI